MVTVNTAEAYLIFGKNHYKDELDLTILAKIALLIAKLKYFSKI